MRLVVAIVAALVLAAFAAAPALAHGDPASEYLVDHDLFLPIQKPLSQREQDRLSSLVEQAKQGGYPLRVALIGSRFDLGTEADAWGQPAAYAAALDQDLAYYYRGPLLVVMPAGFGLHQPGRSLRAENAVLARIRIATGAAGLATAAERAIERLAGAHGVTVSPPRHVTTRTERNAHDRIVIALAACAGLLAWWLLRLARRRATSPVRV